MVHILFFFLNESVAEIIDDNVIPTKMNNINKFRKSKNKMANKTKNNSTITRTHINSIGNTALSKYSKNSYHKKTMYGIDIISIIKILPINSKFLIMVILSV